MQIIVLGMHRSGTSAVARILNLMGAYFGKEGISMPPSADNPKGYWERMDVLELNEKLLKAAGASWCQVSDFNIEGISESAKTEFKQEAGKLLLGLDAHRPWFMKDPRFCLLLPLWRELLELPVCIFVYRNPIQVAQSLRIRDGFPCTEGKIPLNVGIALWEKYNLSALSAMHDLPVISLAHKDLLSDPLGTVNSLYNQLSSANVQGLRMLSDKEVNSFIDPSLHRQRGDSTLEEGFINRQQLLLLQAIEKGKIPSPYPPLSAGALDILQAFEERSVLEQLCRNREERSQNLEAQLSLRNGELHKFKDDFRKQYQSLETRLSKREIEFGNLNERVAELEAANSHLASQRQTLEAQLSEYEGELHKMNDELRKRTAEAEKAKEELALKSQHLQENLRNKEAELHRLQEDARKEIKHQKQEVQRLIGYFEKLHHQAEIVFQSFTWRTGSAFAQLFRVATLRKPEILIQQKIAELANEFVKWKDLYLQAGKPEGAKEGPAPKRQASLKVKLQRECKDISEDSTISVVIPTLNGGNDLTTLLPTLRNQKCINELDIIMVDSGSTDDTLELAERHGCKLLQIPPEDFSHSFSRNLGAKHATGNYTLVLTQDALPPTDWWLFDMLQALKAQNAVAVSCAESPREDADLFYRISTWNHYRFLDVLGQDRVLALPEKQNYESLRKNGQLSDIACLIRTEVFRKYGFRNDYAEDLDLGLRLIRDGHKLVFLGTTKIIHSHNRPAYYHLKRAFVDNLTLEKIFPDFKMPTIKISKLPPDILYTYAALTNLVEIELTPRGEPLAVEGLFEIVERNLSTARSGDFTTVKIGSNTGIDHQFADFLNQVHKTYPLQGGKCNGILIDAMRGFLGGAFEYMRNVYEEIDGHVLGEFKACIYRAFAYQTGAHLAYCFLRASEKDKVEVRKLVSDLAKGV